jgi:hypothetical protein
VASDYAQLERALGPALAANRPDSTTDHVVIALPSYSVSESLLSHYGDRIPALEHRDLSALGMLGRIPSVEFVFVSTRAPAPEVVDYYLSMLPAGAQASARRRLRIISIDDGTPRSVAARLAADPERIADLRSLIGDRPAVIEPWNVTEHEVALALALGVPVNGSAPELRPIAFKSAGRRLFAEAGVPAPLGREAVASIDDVVAAIGWIRSEHPAAPGVVVKHDDSGAGDGNVVIDLGPMDAAADPAAWLRTSVADLPGWYLDDLARGGIVEERVVGTEFRSPSAQVDIRPGGEIVVLATHEQVLGGPGGQVYLGCRFPADPGYAPELARHATAVGHALAARGALGRFSVDFVAAREPGGPWRVFALEINLRKGGTTHPYAALRNLVPGRYEPDRGMWIALDGTERSYSASDNLADPAWTGLPPAEVIRAVAEAGLQFDPATGVGTVLHMLSGLAIDGRFGVTAIARTQTEAIAMEGAVAEAVAALAAGRERG